MTAKEIINGWCKNVFSERQQNKVFPNTFFDAFEADILEITKAGYATEYEVKISRSDFFNDAKKKRDFYKGRAVSMNKFDILKNGERVNYFYYLVPKGLISPEEVPEFAGLTYVEISEVGYYSREKGHYTKPKLFTNTVKAAPKLSKDKFPVDRMMKCLESTYYRFHSMRLK